MDQQTEIELENLREYIADIERTQKQQQLLLTTYGNVLSLFNVALNQKTVIIRELQDQLCSITPESEEEEDE